MTLILFTDRQEVYRRDMQSYYESSKQLAAANVASWDSVFLCGSNQNSIKSYWHISLKNGTNSSMGSKVENLISWVVSQILKDK